MNVIGSEKCNGISKLPNTIAEGGNSGYQAIGLALHFGAAKLVLLGFDMKQTNGKKHWHEDHKQNNPTREAFANWNKRFRVLAAQSPVPIINASRETALDCFPRTDLETALYASIPSA